MFEDSDLLGKCKEQLDVLYTISGQAESHPGGSEDLCRKYEENLTRWKELKSEVEKHQNKLDDLQEKGALYKQK